MAPNHDSPSRPIPSRRRFEMLIAEVRRKRRTDVVSLGLGSATSASGPRPGPVRQGGPRSAFYSFARPYGWIFCVLAILSVVTTLLELARPLASKYIIDNLVLNSQFSIVTKIRLIWVWAVGLLFLLVLSF